MNIPDRWVIVKFVTPMETFYKVLAGWSGGYLDGDSWKLNSGIVEIIEKDNHYDVVGESGSIYMCVKGREGFTVLTSGVLAEIQEHADKNSTIVEVVDIVDVKL